MLVILLNLLREELPVSHIRPHYCSNSVITQIAPSKYNQKKILCSAFFLYYLIHQTSSSLPITVFISLIIKNQLYLQNTYICISQTTVYVLKKICCKDGIIYNARTAMLCLLMSWVIKRSQTLLFI